MHDEQPDTLLLTKTVDGNYNIGLALIDNHIVSFKWIGIDVWDVELTMNEGLLRLPENEIECLLVSSRIVQLLVEDEEKISKKAEQETENRVLDFTSASKMKIRKMRGKRKK